MSSLVRYPVSRAAGHPQVPAPQIITLVVEPSPQKTPSVVNAVLAGVLGTQDLGVTVLEVVPIE